LEENITIEIRVRTISPLKADRKKEFVDHVSQELSRYGVKNVELKDFQYVELRAAEAFQGIIVIFQAIVPLLSIASSTLSLAKTVRQNKGKPTIMVKRKDGSFVELTDGMTEKQVNDALNIGRNEEEGSKTEN
jgi:hypothetical protein